MAELPDCQLVCSVKEPLTGILKREINNRANIHLYKHVDQLALLQVARLFITHGGLGSIKESLYHCVPMLVYPLGLSYVQLPNALKIEHHGLGLRGNIQTENPAVMKQKIVHLLTEIRFNISLDNFHSNCQATYTTDYLSSVLSNVLAPAVL
ncbi:glycosyltransferase [Spirosoma flavus]